MVIKHEVESYKVSHNSQDESLGVEITLNLVKEKKKVYISFIRAGHDLPNNIMEKKEFRVFYLMSEAGTYIDLLRNERPIFFYFYEQNGDSCLSTVPEPIGEEETRHVLRRA